ncbi:MAG: DUF128 domain-containing protein [Armatimonadetes bacterium]|nr:DUF128 domain-containing protein [Armatimonadota bacterium]
MPEIGRKEYAILRVLGGFNEPVGASKIARRLSDQGIDLTERAVRYYLQALDERGLTQSLGRMGRRLTEQGRRELANARVADKLALTLARIDTLSYLTTFDIARGTGSVILNLSLFRQADFDAALRIMRPVFNSRFATSDLVAVLGPGQRVGDFAVPRGMTALGTVCSVTINGILLSHGIPVNSEFGGLVEISGHEPARFTEIIRYGGTSVDPVEVFIKGRATSAGEAVATGSGKVGAGLRTCPSAAREHVLSLIDEMAAWRLRGVIAAAGENQSLMELDIDVGRMAFVVAAGLNPVAAAEEAGFETQNQAMAVVFDYEALQPVAELY